MQGLEPWGARAGESRAGRCGHALAGAGWRWQARSWQALAGQELAGAGRSWQPTRWRMLAAAAAMAAGKSRRRANERARRLAVLRSEAQCKSL
mmetsp:Transcript_15719/g.46443  ORF Transcript_15719/g.46443 Transcript_15719/m.46443 type:complete len:93 (-) Transcript_15719:1171-1449(-)|eukprot:360640-Chlamydomonas_euryale.AAC.5